MVQGGPTHAMFLGRRFHRWKRFTEHPLFRQIHARLALGESVTRTAWWIRDMVPPDDVLGKERLAFDALERSLARFRLLLPTAQLPTMTTIQKMVRQAEFHVDHLNELGALIRLQQIRLDRGLKLEEETGFPSEHVRREVHELAELYRQLRDTRAMMGLDPNVMPPPASMNGASFSQTNLTVKEVRLGEGLERTLVEHPELLPMVMPHLVALEAIVLDESAGVAEPGV